MLQSLFSKKGELCFEVHTTVCSFDSYVYSYQSKDTLMKSLVLFSYQQPDKGSKFRWGVLHTARDTKKQPLNLATINGPYRKNDPIFQRTKIIDYIQTNEGTKAFYRERQNWRIKIPLVGSVVSRLLPK